MNGKQFAKWALGMAAAVAAALIALVAAVDPFFRLGVPERAVFENERYENPGIIRHSEFDTVLMGTSLVCNFRASWLDELTGGQTLKIGYRGGYLSEFDAGLAVAFEKQPDLEAVYFGLDANILVQEEADRTGTMPEYLYDRNPFNDISYYLNKDVYLRCCNVLMERARGNAVPLDEAYVWSNGVDFSKWQSLASYQRPAQVETVLENDAFYAAAEENLAVVARWAAEHPDTEFHLFLSPYPILYWDRAERLGRMDAMLGALEYAIPKLLEQDNVTVHFFLDCTGIVTDMEHYTDHVHFSDEVSRWITEQLVSGTYVMTEENYRPRLDALEELVRHYDYDALLAPYDK